MTRSAKNSQLHSRDPERFYRIREVARLSGVTVRTLHHYDACGLLVPRARSAKGYRLYSGAEILKLQEILMQRALGFSLEAIRQSFESHSADRRDALQKLRREILERLQQNKRMLAAIDHRLALLEDPLAGTADEPDWSRLFDGFEPERYDAEARTRWGGSRAWEIAQDRIRRYGETDWRALKAEQARILSELAAIRGKGLPPESREAMAVAERHRLFIDRWFYPCEPRMHEGLANLYEEDARFAATINRWGDNLTSYLSESIRNNARRPR